MKRRDLAWLIGLTCFLLVATCFAWAESANPNTDWFSQAKYGVFIHFLPSGEAGLKQVEQFDVRVLAGQLEEMGVGYLVLTLGQNSGYFNSPNATYEKRTGYAPGERCATRDLPLDLHQALRPRGIRLLLYLPCQTPNQDARAQKAFGLAQGAKDQPIDVAFAEKWSQVIQEWADRYGDKVSGWWFDGGYEHIHFNEAIAARYAAAVKHGNPTAIVTFNPGVRVIRWTKAEDYTAGELNEPLQVIPTDRWLAGSQWHALTYLGDTWGKRNTRFTDQQWVEWARKVVARQGVFTLDMGPNYDAAAGPVGSLAESQVKQVKAIRAALRAASQGNASPGAETTAGWRKYENNPVIGGKLGTCFDVSVMKEANVHRMWLSWRPQRSIALVTSEDGLHWTERPQVVLGPKPETGWEDDINRPVVLKRDDGYHLWYTGQAKGHSRIGYAVSSDGITWTRRSDRPVLSPEKAWEKVAVMCPHVIWDAAARRFRMWYSGGDQYEPDAIGYATSSDGLNWTRHEANPVFKGDPAQEWERHKVTACQVIQHGGWHIMFYIGFRDIDHAQIGVARSRDGITHWQRHPANPIIRPGRDQWDHDACYKPFALFEGERWLLWYNGRHGNLEQIGVALHHGESLGFK